MDLDFVPGPSFSKFVCFCPIMRLKLKVVETRQLIKARNVSIVKKGLLKIRSF